MSDRPTPETDALIAAQPRPYDWITLAESLEALCKKLELERDELRAENERLSGKVAELRERLFKERKSQLDTLRKANMHMAKALDDLSAIQKAYDFTMSCLKHHHRAKPGISTLVEKAEALATKEGA